MDAASTADLGRNIALLSPDLDLDVAIAKLFSIESDPDLPSRNAPHPRFVFPHPTLRLTVYMSEGDKALGVAELFYGQPAPDGTCEESMLSKADLAKSRGIAGADFIEVTDCDFIGHSYLF